MSSTDSQSIGSNEDLVLAAKCSRRKSDGAVGGRTKDKQTTGREQLDITSAGECRGRKSHGEVGGKRKVKHKTGVGQFVFQNRPSIFKAPSCDSDSSDSSSIEEDIVSNTKTQKQNYDSFRYYTKEIFESSTGLNIDDTKDVDNTDSLSTTSNGQTHPYSEEGYSEEVYSEDESNISRNDSSVHSGSSEKRDREGQSYSTVKSNSKLALNHSCEEQLAREYSSTVTKSAQNIKGLDRPDQKDCSKNLDRAESSRPKTDIGVGQTSPNSALKKTLTRPSLNAILSIKNVITTISREENVQPFNKLQEQLCTVDDFKAAMPESESNNITPNSFMIKVVSNLSIKTCISAVIFDTYYVLIFPGQAVKQDRDTRKHLASVPIKNAYRLCSIGTKSTKVAILGMPSSRITILETKDKMEIKYIMKLAEQQSISNLCHLDTYTKTGTMLPDPLYVFCVAGSGASMASSDNVSLVSPAPYRQGGSRHEEYHATIKLLDTKLLKGINGLTALAWNIIVVSCSEGVKCIQYDDKSLLTIVLWTVPSNKNVTDVCCIKVGEIKHVLASVQNDNRIMLIDNKGHVIQDNVLPEGSMLKPDKISVNGDTILVKQFDEFSWCSYVKEV